MKVGLKNSDVTTSGPEIKTIHQMRHLSFFSEYGKVFGNTEAKTKAQKLYGYLQKLNLTKGFPDSLTNNAKGYNLMATMYAIFALAFYHQYAALPAEKASIETMLKATYDSAEPLFDAKEGAYTSEGDIKYDPPSRFPAQKTYASANILMHVIEGLAQLCIVVPTNQAYKDRLKAVVNYMFDKIYVPEPPSGGYMADFAFEGYDKKDINYGHNMQIVHLLELSVKTLGQQLTPDQKTKLINMCKTGNKGWVPIGSGADAIGYLKENSSKTDVVWWVQAECVLGNGWLAINADDQPTKTDAMTKLIQNLKFIRKHVIDPVNGEWFDTLEPGSLKPKTSDKGHEWKASYHSGRCALILKEYCEKLAKIT